MRVFFGSDLFLGIFSFVVNEYPGSISKTGQLISSNDFSQLLFILIFIILTGFSVIFLNIVIVHGTSICVYNNIVVFGTVDLGEKTNNINQ